MNRTRTPKALHPSIIVVKSDTGTKYIDAYSGADATKLATSIEFLSRARWAKDHARAMTYPPKAQRVPRTFV